MNRNTTANYSSKDYKSAEHPIWCPGCGNFGVLKALYRALDQLQFPPEDVAVVSGIGCSSRLPGYMATYGFNGVHGRILPLATGIKMAHPEITVIGTGGDGDGFSIGIGHIPHAARRNIDMTYIVMDNEIYGMTKGQLSPTSPPGDVTKTSMYGSFDQPIDPVVFMLGVDASFVARGYAGNLKHLSGLIVEAIQHSGFAFIDVLSPCRTFCGIEQIKRMKEQVYYLDERAGHNPQNKREAIELITRDTGIACGVIYKDDRPSYHELYKKIRIKAQSKGMLPIESLFLRYISDDRSTAQVVDSPEDTT